MMMKLLAIILVFFVFYENAYSQDLSQYSHLSYKEIDSIITSAYQREQNFEKAIKYSELARKKALKNAGQKDSLYMSYTYNLGQFAAFTKNYQLAIGYALEVSAFDKKKYGEISLEFAKSIQLLGNLEKIIGNYSSAEKNLTTAIFALKQLLGGNAPKYAEALRQLGLLYMNTESYEQAEPLFLESMAIKENRFGKNSQEYLLILNDVGLLYRAFYKFEEALSIFLQLKNICSEVVGKTHPYYSYTLTNLGGIYTRLKQFNKAEQILLESIDLVQNNKNIDYDIYASQLSQLVEVYQRLEKYDEANLLHQKIIDIRLKTVGENHKLYAMALGDYGNMYEHTKQFKKAKSIYLKVIDFYNKSMTKPSQYYNIYCRLVFLHADIGEYEQAEKYLDTAIIINSLNSDLLSRPSEHLLDIPKYNYINLEKVIYALDAAYYLYNKQYEETGTKHSLQKAMNSLVSNSKIHDKYRNDFNSDEEKFRILKNTFSIAKKVMHTGVLLNSREHVSTLFYNAEQNKSILLMDAIKGRQAKILSNLPDSLITYENELQKQKEKFKKKAILAQTKEEKINILGEQNSLNIDINKFLQRIKKNYPEYHALKYENSIAQCKDIQKLLDDNTLLLEYFITDTATYLFAINSDSTYVYTLSIKKTTLEKNIHTLHRVLSNYSFIKNKAKQKESYNSFTTKAYWFYQNLLEKALSNTPNIKNLIIIPDGELGFLPFETFLTKEASQKYSSYKSLNYLINQYNISYSYSASLWKTNNGFIQKTSNNLILGAAASYPRIDSSLQNLRTAYTYKLRQGLLPIESTKDEIAALATSFEGTFLQDEKCNENYFKNNSDNYEVIHLAMHGIFNKRNPMLSALAFSENQDSLEDNFLYAYEISRLKLNANMVVLSACETGYGKFKQGEGIMSLARSFMYAGVPSLIVSLWAVNDYTTSILMKSFYSELSKGHNKDLALRQAKLEFLKNAKGIMAHPAFWSPFIQMGNTQPVHIKTKGGVMPWVIGGILLILVLSGGFAISRRKKEVS